jgi:uncharacterized membrane protein YgdD (TMEM256/DUF423 family)
MKTTTIKHYLQIASLMMALGISIGAFGAHGLQSYLDEYGISIYNKATSYWFYNTLGLFAIAWIGFVLQDSSKIKWGYYFVLVGTFIFSCSLIILALTHIKWLGAITPIGGTAMIIGWILVFWQLRSLK